MAVYVCGDIHGELDIHKLNKENFPDQNYLTKDDVVIILGDFGLVFNWVAETKEEKYWLNWLDSRSFTTLFVDGNHECFPRLLSYPTQKKYGGEVGVIRPSVFHLRRGEVYDIQGKSFLAMGGADSTDKFYRTEGESWWPEEQISLRDIGTALHNVWQRPDRRVDYVLAHCAPYYIERQIGSFIERTPSSEHLGDLMHQIDFFEFYCGHYHTEARCYDAEDRLYTCLYNTVLKIV